MAVYKVIQDIEAEDKFVGPLTLKQFIFAGITALSLYLSFIFITKHIWYLSLPFFPVILVGGFLAFPWGRDQPTEVWLLARIRFALKPRKRVWDQTGVQELVTITAPKRNDTQYTNNLSQNEVRSRLRALANTIDSRGWAIKNVNVNLYSQPLNAFSNQFSDRLIDMSSLPQEVPNSEVYASDDIMDVQNNPLAQHFDQLINSSSKNHRRAALDHMDEARVLPEPIQRGQSGVGAPAPDYWFINQPGPAHMPSSITPVILPSAVADTSTLPSVPTNDKNLSPEEKALLDKLHKDQDQPDTPLFGHMRVIQPLSVQARQKKNQKQKTENRDHDGAGTKKPTSGSRGQKAPSASMTPRPDPAILELAINNDRDVASLAREANAKLNKNQPNEVVIKLH